MSDSSSLSAFRTHKAFWLLNAVVSAAALFLLTWLLILRDGVPDDRAYSFLPAVNATMNTISATCLVLGWVAVRNGHTRAHRGFMVSAFVASTLFLVSYLVYHYAHGDTHYPADAPLRGAYLFVLISHIVLSIPVVPMALAAFYFAWRKEFGTHRKITRFLAPIWLYVSVTGVLVFAMLRSAGV